MMAYELQWGTIRLGIYKSLRVLKDSLEIAYLPDRGIVVFGEPDKNGIIKISVSFLNSSIKRIPYFAFPVEIIDKPRHIGSRKDA